MNKVSLPDWFSIINAVEACGSDATKEAALQALNRVSASIAEHQAHAADSDFDRDTARYARMQRDGMTRVALEGIEGAAYRDLHARASAASSPAESRRIIDEAFANR